MLHSRNFANNPDAFLHHHAHRVLAVPPGTSGADTLISGSASDFIDGKAGNDHLYGGSGNDSLEGGKGDDYLSGGAGNDTFYVDSYGDQIVEAAGAGTDTIYTWFYTYTLPANVENLIGTNTNTMILIGNSAANSITGADFGDYLIGGAGNDTLIGGLGDDSYLIEQTGDVVNEALDAGWDNVLTTLTTYVAPVNVEEVYDWNTTAAKVTGNALGNYIHTQEGLDSLNGGAGDDYLYADAGNDTMTGGSGADFFEFGADLAADNVDTITDYTSADDSLFLSGALFGFAAGAMDATAFKRIGSGGSAVDSSDRFLYDQTLGKLYFDADGSGTAHVRVLFAVLSTHAVLSGAEFSFY